MEVVREAVGRCSSYSQSPFSVPSPCSGRWRLCRRRRPYPPSFHTLPSLFRRPRRRGRGEGGKVVVATAAALVVPPPPCTESVSLSNTPPHTLFLVRGRPHSAASAGNFQVLPAIVCAEYVQKSVSEAHHPRLDPHPPHFAIIPPCKARRRKKRKGPISPRPKGARRDNRERGGWCCSLEEWRPESAWRCGAEKRGKSASSNPHLVLVQ